ncbi:MAG TPA: adenylate/guanylate cyclase domain-containing protein [Casimicrobiaceae bacterium]|nr:adenylate/guanylate cyclase domain-containing protein [Casimicrobiaceae bacterium]
MNAAAGAANVTLLFTDVEGSSRLWEREPTRMAAAIARHDALARAAIEARRGRVVKTMGDGVHAVFGAAVDALHAALALELALADPAATDGLALAVRCGMHTGSAERRDNDYFGSAVNRAARIAGAAHGGQILLSQATVESIREQLPPGVTLRDLGRVRLRDLASPEHVYQAVHPRLREDFPALRSLESTPNNLPQQVTSFVGRERGQAEVRKLLAQAPLLTLLGMGGLGKTRLSLQVAADVLDEFPDGVWFVELAPVADARLVPQAVASVLGVMEEAGRPVIEALVKFVRERELLVILDNCEHLVHACADLAKQLLQAGSRLKLLASSREHLRVPGEVTYPVQALAVPDSREAAAPDALVRYEAVRLFVDRAQAVRPDFAVSAENAPAIVDICRRLDGIPLALELAAARVRSLPVEAIAERLDDRFRLLTRGARTDLPRQQTLRALIDWSYDLLDSPEKAVFERLAVFAGGFTLEAAETVAQGGAIRHDDVLDLVSALVDKSLVELDAGGTRYRMLETVREYAQQGLVAAEDADAVRTRHLDHYLALAIEAHPQLWGREQGKWLSRLDLERENFLAAHAWCERAPAGAAKGLQLAETLQLYWLPRGLIELGYRVTLEALARPGAQARDYRRSGALYAAAQLAWFMGAFAASRQHGEEAVAIAEEIHAVGRAAAAHLILGYACEALGDRAAAGTNFQASAALAREMGDKARLSFALNALAGHYSEVNDFDAAEPLFEESLSLARDADDPESVAISGANLARLVVERGDTERARALLAEAAAIARDIGSMRCAHDALEVSVGLAVLCGQWAEAARFAGAVQALMEETRLHRTPADDAFFAGQLAKARAALGDDAFAAAEADGQALPYAQALDEAQAWLRRS